MHDGQLLGISGAATPSREAGERRHFEVMRGEEDAQLARMRNRLNSLASLYAASHRLYETLELRDVLAGIKEIIINLVGSECFGVYTFAANGRELTLVEHEGLDDVTYAVLGIGGLVERALGERAIVFGSAATSEPLACVPLLVDGEPAALIVIFGLLDHKPGFVPVDLELLALLVAQGGTALYAAQLHAERASAERGAARLAAALRG